MSMSSGSSDICIGLFGTCGGSQWREPFKAKYVEAGLLPEINFFDPQKPDWKAEDAVIEAGHLANDRVIVFPITNETYAEGSLAEVGFSILNAIRLDDRRHFIVYIEQKLDEKLMADAVRAKASLRARALVMEHMKKLRLDSLYVVGSLEDALQVSMACYAAEVDLAPFKKFNPHRKA